MCVSERERKRKREKEGDSKEEIDEEVKMRNVMKIERVEVKKKERKR